MALVLRHGSGFSYRGRRPGGRLEDLALVSGLQCARHPIRLLLLSRDSGQEPRGAGHALLCSRSEGAPHVGAKRADGKRQQNRCQQAWYGHFRPESGQE